MKVNVKNIDKIYVNNTQQKHQLQIKDYIYSKMGETSKTIHSLRLKTTLKTSPRVLNGHPWVFKSEIEGILPRQLTGQGIGLRDASGRWLGMGIYNPNSQIIWRRYTYDRFEFNDAFIENALSKALKKRETNTVARLVWSEADLLPGLVVDRFHHVLVIQALTLAIDQRLSLIIQTLRQLLPAITTIYLRNDAPSRQYEGLKLENRIISDKPLTADWYLIDGIQYWLDFETGQKTGFYLDQRAQHLAIAQFAHGKTVLDAFCNQGGFGLQAAKAGAKKVLAIDSSKTCIDLVQKNAHRNQLHNIETLEANMFDWLSTPDTTNWDIIVLDPPSFARNKDAREGAIRGYKELNLRALKRLNPGGILASYVCSHAVSRDDFYQLISQAAFDARRTIHIIEETSQPHDHPILVGFPESAYLKGITVKINE